MISLLFKIKSIVSLINWLKSVLTGKDNTKTSPSVQTDYKAELEGWRFFENM